MQAEFVSSRTRIRSDKEVGGLLGEMCLQSTLPSFAAGTYRHHIPQSFFNRSPCFLQSVSAMYFRFSIAILLVVAISIGNVAIEKSSFDLRREISRQQYRKEVLLKEHHQLRARSQELGAPIRLLEALKSTAPKTNTDSINRLHNFPESRLPVVAVPTESSHRLIKATQEETTPAPQKIDKKN